MSQYGLSNLFLGGIWVYAATYPGVKWFEVIPLWALAAVFTVLNLLQFTGTDQTGQTIFLLVSVGVALVAGRSLGLATGWPIPHLPLDGCRTEEAQEGQAGQAVEAVQEAAEELRVELEGRRGTVEERTGADAAVGPVPRRPGRARLAARQDRCHRHGLVDQRREEALERPQQTPPQPLTPTHPTAMSERADCRATPSSTPPQPHRDERTGRLPGHSLINPAPYPTAMSERADCRTTSSSQWAIAGC